MHLFETMWRELGTRGIDFHVEFLARSASHRQKSWQVDPNSIQFPHAFSTDIGPHFRGTKWHFNPALIARLARRKSDYLMIGGPWASISGGLGTLLGRSQRSIAWIEGTSWHAASSGSKSSAVKRWLLRKFDYVATPGLEGERFVDGLFGDNLEDRPPIINLPNIVDDKRFGAPSDIGDVRGRLRSRLGVSSDVKIAIWPARHIAEKGIPEFLSKLSPSNLNNWKILIIGDGPERGNVERTIKKRGLENNVILHDFVEPTAMPELYQGSDLFMLPSVRDANPLSAVEALMCGLPILVSNRIGNFPEALQQDVNGWGFDPFDGLQVEGAVESAFGTPSQKLRSMGLESRRIALEVWESKSVVARFFDQVLERKGTI
jgi:glycosyltransferase involved in cell wall biosynthesis